MKKRDRRLTPTLTGGWSDAVPESTGPSEKMIDTASAFYLKGEGTSRNMEEEKEKSISESGNRVKLLDRNNGLMIKSLEIEENRINICKYGTEQVGIDNAW